MEVFKIIEDFVGIILYEVILNKFNWLVQIKDVVLCRIYRKAVSQKSMEQGAMPNYVEREEAEVVSRDVLIYLQIYIYIYIYIHTHTPKIINY